MFPPTDRRSGFVRPPRLREFVLPSTPAERPIAPNQKTEAAPARQARESEDQPIELLPFGAVDQIIF